MPESKSVSTSPPSHTATLSPKVSRRPTVSSHQRGDGSAKSGYLSDDHDLDISPINSISDSQQEHEELQHIRNSLRRESERSDGGLHVHRKTSKKHRRHKEKELETGSHSASGNDGNNAGSGGHSGGIVTGAAASSDIGQKLNYASIAMKFLAGLAIFLATLSRVLGDVEITSPEDGDTFSGSSGQASIKVEWKDDSSDSDFSLDKIKFYTISLCTGTNNPIQCYEPAYVDQKKLTTTSSTINIPQNAVPNGMFYFQIYTMFTNGADTIHYSPRFKLTGMTGPTSTYVVTATGDQPGAITENYNPAGNTDFSASFTVPYTLQTGKTRFAPMQMQPGSTVTATTWTRRFPSSAVTYYSTKMKSPVVQSTITPGWSYTASSDVNWASVAPYPTNWYSASERVSKASITATKKKRRWLD
ncbi:KRE9 [Candida oxycetoniae]|uniref:KRE9 n=1 Tax=Candida oxycetoniae TaxID=497107 RepID=A0AAI9WZF9_9ASCO|nr:KRE9 [Candida oxycetoniae]KAI3406158.2 KRE9 [Candida oxycetoniae]